MQHRGEPAARSSRAFSSSRSCATNTAYRRPAASNASTHAALPPRRDGVDRDDRRVRREDGPGASPHRRGPPRRPPRPAPVRCRAAHLGPEAHLPLVLAPERAAGRAPRARRPAARPATGRSGRPRSPRRPGCRCRRTPPRARRQVGDEGDHRDAQPAEPGHRLDHLRHVGRLEDDAVRALAADPSSTPARSAPAGPRGSGSGTGSPPAASRAVPLRGRRGRPPRTAVAPARPGRA